MATWTDTGTPEADVTTPSNGRVFCCQTCAFPPTVLPAQFLPPLSLTQNIATPEFSPSSIEIYLGRGAGNHSHRGRDGQRMAVAALKWLPANLFAASFWRGPKASCPASRSPRFRYEPPLPSREDLTIWRQPHQGHTAPSQRPRGTRGEPEGPPPGHGRALICLPPPDLQPLGRCQVSRRIGRSVVRVAEREGREGEGDSEGGWRSSMWRSGMPKTEGQQTRRGTGQERKSRRAPSERPSLAPPPV